MFTSTTEIYTSTADIDDLFFLAENTNTNCANDTTFYTHDSDLHNLFLRLEHDSILAIE